MIYERFLLLGNDFWGQISIADFSLKIFESAKTISFSSQSFEPNFVITLAFFIQKQLIYTVAIITRQLYGKHKENCKTKIHPCPE